MEAPPSWHTPVALMEEVGVVASTTMQQQGCGRLSRRCQMVATFRNPRVFLLCARPPPAAVAPMAALRPVGLDGLPSHDAKDLALALAYHELASSQMRLRCQTTIAMVNAMRAVLDLDASQRYDSWAGELVGLIDRQRALVERYMSELQDARLTAMEQADDAFEEARQAAREATNSLHEDISSITSHLLTDLRSLH